MVLLSDGQANEGVTDLPGVTRLARNARVRGVPVTTIGLGSDYAEDFMEAIAEHGGGRYYYVEKPEQLARIFQEELAVVGATIARNVRIRFDRQASVRAAEVLGYTAEVKGRSVVVTQPEMYAGEARSMLIRLDLAPGKAGPRPLGTLLVEYQDVKTGRPAAFERALSVDYTTDTARVARSARPRVEAETALIRADRAQAESTRLYESGDKVAAKARLRGTQAWLSQKAARLSDGRLKKKLAALALDEEDYDRADRDRRYKKRFLKRSKRRTRLGLRGKRGTYLLDRGAAGYRVERLQKALKDRGVYAGPIDGRFDDRVARAVVAFQTRAGLEIDGVAGPATLRALGLY